MVLLPSLLIFPIVFLCSVHTIYAAISLEDVFASEQESISMELERHPVQDDSSRSSHWNRYRRLFDGTYELVPLKIGTGTHYTWIYAGNPPQRASVIVDTGSHILAFPCSDCENCGRHTDKPFNMQETNTLEYVHCRSNHDFLCQPCHSDDQCMVKQSYSEGSSWTAKIVEDFVWLGNSSVAPKSHINETFGTRFQFGCQIHETGLFTSQISNGIIGMADRENTLVPVLHKNGKLKHKVFSLCFTSSGGSMVLGAPATFKHTEEVSYAKYYKTSTNWFTVRVKDVLINKSSIGVNPSVFRRGKQVIVDSGTTDSYFPSEIAESFKETFEEVSGLSYMSDFGCTGYAEKDVALLPNISIVLEGVDGNDVVLEIPPQQYLGSETGKRCSTLFLSEPTGGVIGANLMMGYDVIFDSPNEKIGFARANCDWKEEGTKAPKPSTIAPKSEESAGSEQGTKIPTTPVPSVSSETPKTTQPESETDPSGAPSRESPGGTTSPKTESPQTTTASPTSAPSTTAPPASAPSTTAPPTSAPSTTAPPTSFPTTTAPPKSAPPTSAPTPPPTTTETGNPDATKVPTTADPTDKNPALHMPSNLTTANSTTSANGGITGEENNPLILTISGVVLSVLFMAGIVYSCRKRKKETKWTKLHKNDPDDEQDEEYGLVSVARDNDGKALQPYSDRPERPPLESVEDFEIAADDDDFFDAEETVHHGAAKEELESL